MSEPPFTVPDPRVFPAIESAAPERSALYALAEESLAAESQQRADACDRELRAALAKQWTTTVRSSPQRFLARHRLR